MTQILMQALPKFLRLLQTAVTRRRIASLAASNKDTLAVIASLSETPGDYKKRPVISPREPAAVMPRQVLYWSGTFTRKS